MASDNSKQTEGNLKKAKIFSLYQPALYWLYQHQQTGKFSTKKTQVTPHSQDKQMLRQTLEPVPWISTGSRH